MIYYKYVYDHFNFTVCRTGSCTKLKLQQPAYARLTPLRPLGQKIDVIIKASKIVQIQGETILEALIITSIFALKALKGA